MTAASTLGQAWRIHPDVCVRLLFLWACVTLVLKGVTGEKRCTDFFVLGSCLLIPNFSEETGIGSVLRDMVPLRESLTLNAEPTCQRVCVLCVISNCCVLQLLMLSCSLRGALECCVWLPCDLTSMSAWRQVNRMREELDLFNFGVVICDECHYLKNQRAARTKVAAFVACVWVFNL